MEDHKKPVSTADIYKKLVNTMKALARNERAIAQARGIYPASADYIEQGAAAIEELSLRLAEVEVDRSNTFKSLMAAQSEIKQLKEELLDEKYRHDRVQDFEVAESLMLAAYKDTGLSPEQIIDLKCKLERMEK